MKGKEALSAARRRIAELEVEVATRASKATQSAAEHRAVVTQLRDRVRELEGVLVREVAAIAESRVEAVKAELEAERAAWKELRGTMAKATFTLLRHEDSRLTSASWALLADIFGEGKNMGMLVADDTSTRDTRRVSTKRARHIDELLDSGRLGDDMRKGPLPKLDRHS